MASRKASQIRSERHRPSVRPGVVTCCAPGVRHGLCRGAVGETQRDSALTGRGETPSERRKARRASMERDRRTAGAGHADLRGETGRARHGEMKEAEGERLWPAASSGWHRGRCRLWRPWAKLQMRMTLMRPRGPGKALLRETMDWPTEPQRAATKGQTPTGGVLVWRRHQEESPRQADAHAGPLRHIRIPCPCPCTESNRRWARSKRSAAPRLADLGVQAHPVSGASENPLPSLASRSL